jgi:phospholipid/cholesterol/gamma-HCH transport system substrate-binding protein
MRLFSTEAKVGVVVLTALGALTWLTFQVGEFRFREKGYLIEAVFRTVSGLEDKAKVRLAGVAVGSVDRIYLRDGLAHAQLRLDDGVIVRKDSVISVASIGILSERYVDITAGSLQAPILPPGSVVAGRELTDLDQLIARLSDASESIKSLAESISSTFGGEESSVAELIGSTNELVEQVSQLLDDNRRRISELLGESAGMSREIRGLLADNREELHGTIANLRELTATLNRRVDELGDEAAKTAGQLREESAKTAETVRGEIAKTAEELRVTLSGGREDLQGALTALKAAAGKAEQSAETLTAILRKVDGGTGTIGELVNDDASLRKVDRAVDQFGGIAEKINSGQGSIGRLVTDDRLVGKLETAVDSANRVLGEADRIRMFLGYRGEYLFRGDDVKNYVTMKFQPRDDKYYLLELVDDPAGRRSITNTTSTIERPEGGFDLNERTVVTEEGKLKFSVEFAKDFGPLTFRGGLLESQGGAGLDYRIFGDRLRLSVESWDFGREEGPHLKLSGRLKLYKDVFLSAGVDDVSEEDRRSAFVGAGILFSDEDLKYLLSLSRFSQ